MPQIQTILDQVAKRIVPGKQERAKMAQLARKLETEVHGILDSSGFE